MFLISSCSYLCPILWSQVLSREWRYPTTPSLLPIKLHLILEVWQYFGFVRFCLLWWYYHIGRTSCRLKQPWWISNPQGCHASFFLHPSPYCSRTLIYRQGCGLGLGLHHWLTLLWIGVDSWHEYTHILWGYFASTGTITWVPNTGEVTLKCIKSTCMWPKQTTGISLGMHSANERCQYNVTTSLIGWVHT